MSIPFDNLPFLPHLIATVVTARPYTGTELCNHRFPVVQTEEKRLAMTANQVDEFAGLCYKRCKQAYEAGAEWFLKIVNAKANRGRDQLFLWISHWLAGYLHDPNSFRNGA